MKNDIQQLHCRNWFSQILLGQKKRLCKYFTCISVIIENISRIGKGFKLRPAVSKSRRIARSFSIQNGVRPQPRIDGIQVQLVIKLNYFNKLCEYLKCISKRDIPDIEGLYPLLTFSARGSPTSHIGAMNVTLTL